jgi:hypothetical protein
MNDFGFGHRVFLGPDLAREARSALDARVRSQAPHVAHVHRLQVVHSAT